MRILRASDRVAAPWKNGGGTTTEVAVFPAGAGFDDFGWRISIADIVRGGPFSQFPGIDRTLAMLKGEVSLSVAGRKTIALSAGMPPVEFPGDVATSAELTGEAAADLNVMTRRGVFTARVTRRSCADAILAPSSAAAMFAFPLIPATLRNPIADIPLVPRDAIALLPGESAVLYGPPQADFYAVEIFPAGKTA
ncbi:MAG: HutD family protein [Proteobacteria bacterium]|nr:HutD family protein [Pseudomonadota bacterium]